MAGTNPQTSSPDFIPDQGGGTPDFIPHPADAAVSAEPEASGFLPSVAQFVEGRSPIYQDADPFWASMKQSVAPANLVKNLYGGIKGAVKGAAEMGSDLMSNPNWFATMPAGQRPSTMQKFVTDPAREQVAKAQTSPDTLEAAGHYAAAAIPLIGPWLASLGEQAGRGDVGGAAAQGVGGYLGTKALQQVPKAVGTAVDLPKTIMEFQRRAKTASDVTEAAAGHYKSTVQPAIQTLAGALQREGAKTLNDAISADRAAQTVQGRGTISAAPAILEAAKAIEETGHFPSPATRTLLNKLNSQSLMTLEDAKNLRSDFGEAASRVRQNNPKAYKVLRTAYEELGNGMKDRVQELQGTTKPFDHYNNEFRAYYELREGIAGQMMQSIADRHEAIPQLEKFADADLSEIQAQMKKYGLDADALGKAQKQAKSIVAANDSISGKLRQSAYRTLLGGGLPAATVASVALIGAGAGLHGMLPLALAAYAGSRMKGFAPSMETGQVLQKLRMTPNASQIRTLVEGPQSYTYGGPEFEGFKRPGAPSTPPPSEPPKAPEGNKAQQVKAVQERRTNPSNFPTAESRRASDAAFAKNYPIPEDYRGNLSPMEKDLWQQSAFGQKPPEDIGAKVREKNPEPTRKEVKAAQLKKSKEAKK